MATLADLRKRAKGLGIPASEIKAATTADALAAVISSHGKPAKKSGAVKKSAAKSAPAKKAAAKKSSGSKSAPVKSTRTTGTTKRPTAAKAKSNGYEPKGGRNLLDSVDYNETDGWNAREGSAPDRIVKALKKFRGNREKVFDFLSGDLWDFVGKKMRDGSKRSKADAEKMLRYRIARTEWDFAIRTGQHDKATNRVEYGTGGTGEGTFKRAKSAAKSKAASTSKRGSSKAKSAASKTKTRGAKSKTAASKRKTARR